MLSPMNINMSKIESLRQELDWSITRFIKNKELGISRQTYYNLLNGKHEPQIATVLKLAKALGLKPEDLIEWNIKNQ